MAKIKLGAIVTDIRGKLGGHVFSKNRGGAYMRTKVTPVNPATARQTFVRAIFAAISSAWSSITVIQRGSFTNLVDAYAKTDIFGDIKIPSGKSLHQRLNQNLGVSGQAYIDLCSAPVAVASSEQESNIWNSVADTFELKLAEDTTGSKVVIFMTPPLSAGTKFVKNKLKIIGVFPGVVAGTVIDLYPIVSDVLGYEFSALLNLHVGVKIINNQGQNSPMSVTKTAVVA